jgi:hypothetical protein
MVFYFAATHGAGPAIARFSIAHHITSPAAWAAALVMRALADVLTRLAVVYLRGRQLTAPSRWPRHPPRSPPVPESVGGPRHLQSPMRRRRPRRLIHATRDLTAHLQQPAMITKHAAPETCLRTPEPLCADYGAEADHRKGAYDWAVCAVPTV